MQYGYKKNEKKNGRRLSALFLGALLTVSVLTGCGGDSGAAADENNPGGEDGVFTIAYAPNESNTEAADARQGLAEELQEVLDCEVEEIQASDYNAIIEALRTGNADMAYMGSQALALGVERTDLEPIVMKAEEGDPERAIYHSVLIARADNDEINAIEDIQGKTMAFVDPDSTSGNLVPTAEIIQAFPDENLNSDMLHTNGDFFEAIRRGCRRSSRATSMWRPFPTRFWPPRSRTALRRRATSRSSMNPARFPRSAWSWRGMCPTRSARRSRTSSQATTTSSILPT